MTEKKTKRKVKLFGRTFGLWTLLGVSLLVLAVGFLCYNLYLDRQDRQKFDNIEMTIDTLSNRIEQEFGLVGEQNNYCYESSEKFTKGPTICRYEISYTMEIRDFEKIIDRIDSLVPLNRRDGFGGVSFWTESEDFSCSFAFESTKQVAVLECSDYARSNYYDFKY